MSTAAVIAILCLVAPGGISVQPAQDPILQDLSHPDARHRVSALRALRQAGDPAAAGTIAKLLTDPVEDVQFEAIGTVVSLFSVERLDRPSRRALIIEVRGSGTAERAFGNGPISMRPIPVPPEIIAGLIRATDSRGQRVRLEATWAIGALVRPVPIDSVSTFRTVIEALGGRLGYQWAGQRVASAIVLAKLFIDCGPACRPAGSDKVGNALIEALNDSSAEMQQAATQALGALGYDQALQALSDRFAHFRSGEKARAAFDALARIGHPGSRVLFRDALTHKDALIRAAAIDGLARAGDIEGVAIGERVAASDMSSAVILAAAFAQHKTGRADRTADIVRATETAVLRPQALGYLAELGPAVAPDVAAALGGLLPVARLQVVRVLGLTGTASTAEALEALKGSGDAALASAVDQTVAWIKARDAR